MAVLEWRYRCCAAACGVGAACSGGAAAAVLRRGLCRGDAAVQWRCFYSGGAVPWRCCAVAELDKEVARKVLGIRRQVLREELSKKLVHYKDAATDFRTATRMKKE